MPGGVLLFLPATSSSSREASRVFFSFLSTSSCPIFDSLPSTFSGNPQDGTTKPTSALPTASLQGVQPSGKSITVSSGHASVHGQASPGEYLFTTRRSIRYIWAGLVMCQTQPGFIRNSMYDGNGASMSGTRKLLENRRIDITIDVHLKNQLFAILRQNSIFVTIPIL